jgi:hypothetical protein
LSEQKHEASVFFTFPFMKNLSTYALIVAMAAVTASCKKDSEDAPAPTKSELLTAKNWRLTDVKLAGTPIYNSGLFDNCLKDNLYKFNLNKALTIDEGATKCDPTDPQTQTGSWDFTTNETRLKITDSFGDSQEGEIATLSSTSLVLRDPNYQGSGQVAELIYTAQ